MKIMENKILLTKLKSLLYLNKRGQKTQRGPLQSKKEVKVK